ncbi:hypothetical protein ACTA71_001971 [Dictyostelium dimigraforme]
MKTNYLFFILIYIIYYLNFVYCVDKNIKNDTSIILDDFLDIQHNRKLFPKITHQDIENIRQIRRMNLHSMVKSMSTLNVQDLGLGILAGLEKSVNPNPNECIDSVRTAVDNTNQVFFDITHFFGITIQEFLTLIQIFPTIVKDDIRLYNVCGADIIVRKIGRFAHIIKNDGMQSFLEYAKNALYSNPFYLIPVTRGLLESIVAKNYQMLGVHIGEYLGILFNGDDI